MTRQSPYTAGRGTRDPRDNPFDRREEPKAWVQWTRGHHLANRRSRDAQQQRQDRT